MVTSVRNSNSAAAIAWRLAACAVGAAVLATSCSSSDEQSAPTTANLPETIAPVTTEAATVTTELATTTVAPSTTEAATTTTVDSVADADAAVREAVALAQTTFSACLVSLPACDPSSLAAARAGDLLDRNTKLINEWNSLGYTVRDRDKFRFVVDSVIVDPALTSAVATVCIADGSRLVLPNAAPDGSDVVIDDEYTSGRSEWDLRLDTDGVWRVYDFTPIGASATEDVCGAG